MTCACVPRALSTMAAAASQGAMGALEDHHLHRRPALRRHHRSLRARQADERASLLRLCRASHPPWLRATSSCSTTCVKGVRAAIEARGASLLYLPPYSPDPNPIELVLRQAEGALAQGSRAKRRGPVAAHRTAPRCLQPRRMRRLQAKSGLSRYGGSGKDAPSDYRPRSPPASSSSISCSDCVPPIVRRLMRSITVLLDTISE
jgi:hypothetical protein